MGFEVCFHYYEKSSDGRGYDVQEPKSFNKHIGKYEEVPIEDLAKSIMLQLARRDIMVFDVEIYEYAKKKVSFKETKGGVVIKNRKFLLDGSIVSCVAEDLLEEDSVEEESYVVETNDDHVKAKKQEFPIRYEVFFPESTLVPILAKKGYKLTSRKKYPIFKEKTVMTRVNGPYGSQEMPSIEYIIEDDDGKRINISSLHFIPEEPRLFAQDLLDNANQSKINEVKLSYMGEYDNSMPVLRR